MTAAYQNLNGSPDLTTPLSGLFVIRGLAHERSNCLPYLNSLSPPTMKIWKGDTKCENGVVWGS